MTEAITVTGTDAAGRPVNVTTLTAADGSWSFAALPLSDSTGYTITENQPRAWADGKDHLGSLGGTAGGVLGNDTVSRVVLNGSVDASGYDFGERGASLAGQVFNDADNNGTRGTGEVGVAGTTITLTGTDIEGNPVSRTVTTNANGAYSFTDLPVSGSSGYTLTETQPNGFADGLDTVGSLGGALTANDRTTVAINTPGGSGTGYDFGERFDQPASLAGRVYFDSNHDRVDNDGTGTGRGGWIVELVQRASPGSTQFSVIASTTTNNAGNYSFANLVPGNYEIRFRNPDNGATWGRPQSSEPGVDLTLGTIEKNFLMRLPTSGVVSERRK